MKSRKNTDLKYWEDKGEEEMFKHSLKQSWKKLRTGKHVWEMKMTNKLN